MKIELSPEQVEVLLEALDALSENAEAENDATSDQDIHESNDAKLKEAAGLYKYLANIKWR